MATPEELMDLLSEEGKAANQIRGQLKGITTPVQLLLLEENTQLRARAQLEVLKALAPSHDPVILVSLNRPASDVMKELKKGGMEAEKFYYVDAITHTGEGKELEGDRFKYLANCKDLVEITVAIDRFREAGKGHALVYLDSFTTLLVFHDAVVLEKFAHALIAKLRGAEASGVYVLSAHTNAKMLDAVSEFCDRIVRV